MPALAHRHEDVGDLRPRGRVDVGERVLLGLLGRRRLLLLVELVLLLLLEDVLLYGEGG